MLLILNSNLLLIVRYKYIQFRLILKSTKKISSIFVALWNKKSAHSRHLVCSSLIKWSFESSLIRFSFAWLNSSINSYVKKISKCGRIIIYPVIFTYENRKAIITCEFSRTTSAQSLISFWNLWHFSKSAFSKKACFSVFFKNVMMRLTRFSSIPSGKYKIVLKNSIFSFDEYSLGSIGLYCGSRKVGYQ